MANEFNYVATLCQRGLEIVDADKQPGLWLLLRGELANVMASNPLRTPQDPEDAISIYQEILVHEFTQNQPEIRITNLINLAATYLERLRGSRAENIDATIELLEEALQSVDQNIDIEAWINIKMNLGSAYQWARIRENQGTSYQDRVKGEQRANLELAITCYKDALTVISQDGLPQDWARLMTNLGNAYNDRVHGDPAENIEQAIQCYERALTVRTRAVYPFEWVHPMSSSDYQQPLFEQVCQRL